MEEAERLCDHIIIIDQGQILREGSIVELLEEDRNEKLIEFTLEFKENAPAARRPDLPFPVQWNEKNGGGQIIFNELEKELPYFLDFLKEQNIRLKSLECRRRTLDDLFISLTGRRLDE